jgi:hypothetical protein
VRILQGACKGQDIVIGQAIGTSMQRAVHSLQCKAHTSQLFEALLSPPAWLMILVADLVCCPCCCRQFTACLLQGVQEGGGGV